MTEDISRKMSAARRASERENVSKTRMMMDNPIDIHQLDQFLKEAKAAPKLSSLLMGLLAERDMSYEDFGAEANIGRSTVYKIMNGKQLPEKDMLLRMAFVLGLSFEETQSLLKTGHRAVLSASTSLRDIAVIFGLQNRLTLDEMDEILMEREMDTLTPLEKKVSGFLEPLMNGLDVAGLICQAKLDSSAFMEMLQRTGKGACLEALDLVGDDFEKDDLIRIAFVLHLNRSNTQRLLRIGHRAFLNSTDPRDALILDGLAAELGLAEMEALLMENDMQTLSPEV